MCTVNYEVLSSKLLSYLHSLVLIYDVFPDFKQTLEVGFSNLLHQLFRIHTLLVLSQKETYRVVPYRRALPNRCTSPFLRSETMRKNIDFKECWHANPLNSNDSSTAAAGVTLRTL